jgi:S-DNA-T family DNA segregation ATPase FtsK/SpoIIIE
MASYQSRDRDPLLDENTAAMLERRGRELLGIGLLIVAALAALMLASYSPSDPGWMVANDAPVANYLGGFGAALASSLIIIFGMGIWAAPVLLAAWGMRFVTHRGADRVLPRMFFAVFAILAACLYATTLQPSQAWIAAHGFGLGGLLGDTLLGIVLGLIPTGAALGIKVLSLGTFVLTLWMMTYVMGFDRAEMAALRVFFIGGLIETYSAVLGAGTKGAQHISAAQARRSANAAPPDYRRSAAMPQNPAAPRAAQYQHRTQMPPPISQSYGAPQSFDTLRAHDGANPAAAGVFSRLANPAAHTRPEPVPELIERALPSSAEIPAPNDARLRSRISDAVRNVAANPPPPRPITALRTEPPVLRTAEPTAPPQPAPRPLRAPLLADTRPAAIMAQPKAIEDDLADFGHGEWVPEHHYDPDQPFDQGFDAAPSYATPAWPSDSDGYSASKYPEPRYPDAAMPRVPNLVLGPDLRRSKVQVPPKKPLAPSRRAQDESQPRLRFEDRAPQYDLPPLSLLTSPDTVQRYSLSHEALEENARMLESVLDDYGVKGEIVSVRPGPVVTMYELEPAPGLKASRVIGLADDIARSMSALSARVSTVPGRTVIGIELPNATREKVVLREIISARDFGDSAMRLPLALGKDIGGDPVVANLAKMPHLLIAGTTGSGKSVAINTMILSLLYKLSPDECRLIMIDPKMLELSVYDGIPHLLSPVVTDPKKAVVALKWVVSEMEERYRKMSKMGVRNIEGYNGRVREALAKGEMFRRTIQTGFDENTGEPVFETEEFQPIVLPYIVVVVDEMADLMMVAGKEIEACIQRLAQMARASGIHLIMATQRPSVDVITGTIKANFPTRISFQVTSKIDSRTILGEQGAEQLLGMGDMLFMAGGGRISRIHGPFVSDEEVEEIVNHLKSYGPPSYVSGVVESRDEDSADVDAMLGLGGEASDDALYDQAVAIVAKDRKCSTSYIQRKLGIGYNKAARLVEQMEENLVVTTANHVGKREILLPEH